MHVYTSNYVIVRHMLSRTFKISSSMPEVAWKAADDLRRPTAIPSSISSSATHDTSCLQALQLAAALETGNMKVRAE